MHRVQCASAVQLVRVVLLVPCGFACTTTSTAGPKDGSGAGPAAVIQEEQPDATALIESRSGSAVTGVVKFYEHDGAVRIVADLQGLSPGLHGFHLHEVGDCSAPDASSAKGHWNPGGVAHGGPGASQHHAGDLGNLEADAQGRAHIDAHSASFGIAKEPSALGRAVVVHEKPDDLSSQPAGNAGPRQGCGVVVAGSAL